VEGRSGDVEPRFVFSFRAFRLPQGSVLCFDASGAVVELRVLGNGDRVSWHGVLLPRRVVVAQVLRVVRGALLHVVV